MKIEELILNHLKKHNQVKVSDIVKETGFSRAYVNRFFKKLRNEGKIALVGKANKAKYVLPKNTEKSKSEFSWSRILSNKDIAEDQVFLDAQKESSVFDDLNQNIYDILNYSFTEMLNNAIDHSKSNRIKVEIEKKDKNIEFKIFDWGIGIFNDIMEKFKLDNIFDAISLLTKGKHTTKPEAHTGEGIFFTSKAADKMEIKSSNKKIIFDNQREDIFVKDSKKEKGTTVRFIISVNSSNNLSDIFNEYTGEEFSFDKTKVSVKLYELSEKSYVSRSQARRLLFGLDKFGQIVLDFKNVETAGQAFADEIFRVWQKKHPDIQIHYINANDNVEFMIKKAISSFSG